MQDSQIVCTDGDGLKRVAGLLQSPFVGAAPGIGLNEQQAWRGALSQGRKLSARSADVTTSAASLLAITSATSTGDRRALKGALTKPAL